MSEILHRVELPDGSFANTVGPIETIEKMYPTWDMGSMVTEVAANISDISDIKVAEVSVSPFNSSLRFKEVGEDKLAILGNTKTGTCAVSESCGTCALAGSGLTVVEMAEKNCSRAKTAEIFQGIEQEARGAFVLLPTSDESFVVSEDSFTPEFNGDELLQNRLKSANSVVFTKSWMEQQGLEQISVAMNGADGSFGVAVTEILGEILIIPFCSMRTNMGDSPEGKQILRQAFNAFFDSVDADEETRASELSSASISIQLSASASLPNFAHKIQIPEEENPYAQKLRSSYPELIEQADGAITPRIVLHDQYAGALERGHIFSESDAWLGIQSDPYSPTACPIEGETCHVDYRAETEYSLKKQLIEMGISEENIEYSEKFVLDPSSSGNNMASNRRENNNGVASAMTNRTLNGMTIRLRDMQAEHDARFNRAAELLAVYKVLHSPLEAGNPPIDPVDPFVSLYEIDSGEKAPPRELWGTEENREAAESEGFHPMAYWLVYGETPSDPELLELYDNWLQDK